MLRPPRSLCGSRGAVQLGAVALEQVTVPPEGKKLTSLSCYVTSALDASSNYSRCKFVIKEGGTYLVTVKKVNAEGNVIAELSTYQGFAYSDEYNTDIVATDIELEEKLSNIASYGNGAIIEDLYEPNEIFAKFVTTIERSFDPRFLFMILAIVLFVTDIAIRKFRFKWPHEIIRDRRNGAAGKKGGSGK